MKQAVYWLAKHTGIFALCRLLTRKDIRILCYHGIWMGQDHFGNFLFMSPQKFSHRIHQLKQLGFPLVSLDEALERREQNTLANFTTVITIDDGWYGTYRYMLPELKESGFPATVYVTSYYSENQLPVADVVLQYMLSNTSLKSIDLGSLAIGKNERFALETSADRARAHALLRDISNALETAGNREQFLADIGQLLGMSYLDIKARKLFNLMTFEQIAECVSQGVDIQLHTHRHRISEGGKSTIEQELADNRARLEPLVKRPLRHFCYPSGVYQQSVWPELEAQGIESATTTEAGFVRTGTHRYALPRILDGQDVSDLEFEAEMSGFGELKRRLKHLVSSAPQ